MILLASAFAFMLVAALLMGVVTKPFLIACGVLNVFTLAVYGVDKHAAINGRRRVAESTLHLCSLLGGWPGAALAQVVFNHKRRKQPFQMIFLVTSLINGGALLALVLLR